MPIISAVRVFVSLACFGPGLPLIAATLPPDPAVSDSRMTMVMNDLDKKIGAMANVVIHERVSRFVQAGDTVRTVGALEADVEIFNGTECYYGIRQKDKMYAHMEDIAGAWSTGEVTTVLQVTRAAFAADIAAPGPEAPSPDRVMVMKYRYPAESHRWLVMVDSLPRWLDIEAEIYLSRETGEILRVIWKSTPLPKGAQGIDLILKVDYQDSSVAGQLLALPSTSTYSVLYRNSGGKGREVRMESNQTRYYPVARYRSETVVRFGD